MDESKPSSTPKSKYKPASLLDLLPAFRLKIGTLLANLTMAGHDPIPISTGRTPIQANANVLAGTGIKDSMHLYGLAADIISATKGWSDPEFFDALGLEAERLGLTWGGRFKNRPGGDRPHVQAIPVAAQNAIRALKSPETRNAYVALYYNSAGVA